MQLLADMKVQNRHFTRNTVIECVMVLSHIGRVFIRQRRLALWNDLDYDFVQFSRGKVRTYLSV